MTDPTKMSCKKLVTKVIRERLGRNPHQYELSPDRVHQLIETLSSEKGELEIVELKKQLKPFEYLKYEAERRKCAREGTDDPRKQYW